MLAALEGNSKIGEFLLANGADVSVVNRFGESALSLAAHGGHIHFVKLMKAHGASAAVRPHGNDLESWLRTTSGLAKAKVDAIMEAV